MGEVGVLYLTAYWGNLKGFAQLGNCAIFGFADWQKIGYVVVENRFRSAIFGEEC